MRGHQQGSVLILMPAVVLVVLILGAIAVDSAVAYLGHRELSGFAADVADQAAAGGLDQRSFYSGGPVRLEPALVEPIVQQAWAAEDGSGGLTITSVTPTISADGRTITVNAVGTVHNVFGPALGSHSTIRLTATASATLAEVARH